MARKATKRKKQANEQPARRRALGHIAAWAAGGLVVLGGGAAIALDVQRKLEERDLSVIGQGVPVVMQLHDPTCPLCASLQRQARRATKNFGANDVLFRVADITTDAGAQRQRLENLPHVTLVLYDGTGKRVHVIQGVTPASELTSLFERHLGLTPS